MTFFEAWHEALHGRAVSRKAWRDPDKLVTLAKRKPSRRSPATNPLDLSLADAEADDWFVVGSVH